MKFKSVVGIAVAAALFASSAIAADIAPLPAGKPAGTKQADLIGLTGWTLVLVAAAAGVGIAAAAGAFNSSTSTSGTHA